MSYLDELQKELRELLAKEPKLEDVDLPADEQEYHQALEELAEQQVDWENQVCAFVRNKILQSYKNGAATERARKQKPKPKSKASK